MAAALARLAITGGIAALKCPMTGITVIGAMFGFAPNADHSPHLRFFSDWTEDFWVANPFDLPNNQARYQHEVVEILSTWDKRSTLIAKCVAQMPASVLILELTNPFRGIQGGEICYAAFDLGAPAKTRHVRLRKSIDG